MVNPKSLKNLKHFEKGNEGGSAPKGKRISTWMVELGQLFPEELEAIKPKLPVNGLIAFARIKASMKEKYGEASTEIILERTEGNKPIPIELNRGMTDEEVINRIRSDGKQR